MQYLSVVWGAWKLCLAIPTEKFVWHNMRVRLRAAPMVANSAPLRHDKGHTGRIIRGSQDAVPALSIG